MVLNKTILGIALLMLLSFSVIAGTPLILQEGNFYYEDREIGFWETLLKPSQQAVIESSILSGQRANPDTTVTAKLIYIPKYDAENYNIEIYLYDLNLKKHYSVKQIQGGTKRNKGSRYEATVQFKPSEHLTSFSFNHNIGVVGVLNLQVKKTDLPDSIINNPLTVCKSNGLCWIKDKYNEVGGIQTNAFNPPFLYYKSEATACKIEYVDKPVCEQTTNTFSIYQNQKQNDCSIQKQLVKRCNYGDTCSNGQCIKSPSCSLSGKVAGEICINNIVNQRIYNKDCIITNVPTGLQCEIDLPEPDPCANNACDSDTGIICEDVTFYCANGETITTAKCEDNSLVLTEETCESTQPVCPSVCTELYVLEAGVQCKFNACGSGCGSNGITTFDTQQECLKALNNDPYANKFSLMNYIKNNPLQITIIGVLLTTLVIIIWRKYKR